jgi:hypothetical protein
MRLPIKRTSYRVHVARHAIRGEVGADAHAGAAPVAYVTRVVRSIDRSIDSNPKPSRREMSKLNGAASARVAVAGSVLAAAAATEIADLIG